MLLPARPLATTTAAPGPDVERSTMTRTRLPSLTPSGPSATALTMSGVGRLTRTISASSATAFGDATTFAPLAASASVACFWVSKMTS